MLHSILPIVASLSAIMLLPAAALPVDTKNPVRTVYEFPSGTYVENLAVRSNGQVLLDVLNLPHLFLIDPLRSLPPTPVHTFPEIGLAGIAGNYSPATGTVGLGSWTIYSVDLAGVSLGPTGALLGQPRVSKVVDVTPAKFLNGMSLLSAEDRTILVGDTQSGDIYRVDIPSGAYTVVINNNDTAAFGRGETHKNVLYVSTAGGLVTPVDGDITIGGQLVAVSTRFRRTC